MGDRVFDFWTLFFSWRLQCPLAFWQTLKPFPPFLKNIMGSYIIVHTYIYILYYTYQFLSNIFGILKKIWILFFKSEPQIVSWLPVSHFFPNANVKILFAAVKGGINFDTPGKLLKL
jgi:hypothetical protein